MVPSCSFTEEQGDLHHPILKACITHCASTEQLLSHHVAAWASSWSCRCVEGHLPEEQRTASRQVHTRLASSGRYIQVHTRLASSGRYIQVHTRLASAGRYTHAWHHQVHTRLASGTHTPGIIRYTHAWHQVHTRLASQRCAPLHNFPPRAALLQHALPRPIVKGAVSPAVPELSSALGIPPHVPCTSFPRAVRLFNAKPMPTQTSGSAWTARPTYFLPQG